MCYFRRVKRLHKRCALLHIYFLFLCVRLKWIRLGTDIEENLQRGSYITAQHHTARFGIYSARNRWERWWNLQSWVIPQTRFFSKFFKPTWKKWLARWALFGHIYCLITNCCGSPTLSLHFLGLIKWCRRPDGYSYPSREAIDRLKRFDFWQ